jgi:hypothetical protein
VPLLTSNLDMIAVWRAVCASPPPRARRCNNHRPVALHNRVEPKG